MSDGFLAAWVASLTEGYPLTADDIQRLQRVQQALQNGVKHHEQARAASPDTVYWAEARGRQTEHVLGVYRTEAEARARCEQHAADTRKYKWGKDPFIGDGWHRYVLCMTATDGSDPIPLEVLCYEWGDPFYRWRDASHA